MWWSEEVAETAPHAFAVVVDPDAVELLGHPPACWIQAVVKVPLVREQDLTERFLRLVRRGLGPLARWPVVVVIIILFVFVVRGLLALLALGLGRASRGELSVGILVLEPCEFVGFAEEGFKALACAGVRRCATLIAPRGAGAEGDSVSYS